MQMLKEKNPKPAYFYIKTEKEKYRNRTSYTEGKQGENSEEQKRN